MTTLSVTNLSCITSLLESALLEIDEKGRRSTDEVLSTIRFSLTANGTVLVDNALAPNVVAWLLSNEGFFSKHKYLNVMFSYYKEGVSPLPLIDAIEKYAEATKHDKIVANNIEGEEDDWVKQGFSLANVRANKEVSNGNGW